MEVVQNTRISLILEKYRRRLFSKRPNELRMNQNRFPWIPLYCFYLDCIRTLEGVVICSTEKRRVVKTIEDDVF